MQPRRASDNRDKGGEMAFWRFAGANVNPVTSSTSTAVPVRTDLFGRLGLRQGADDCDPTPDQHAMHVTTLGPEGPSFDPHGHFLPASGRQSGSIHRPTPEVLRLSLSCAHPLESQKRFVDRSRQRWGKRPHEEVKLNLLPPAFVLVTKDAPRPGPEGPGLRRERGSIAASPLLRLLRASPT